MLDIEGLWLKRLHYFFKTSTAWVVSKTGLKSLNHTAMTYLTGTVHYQHVEDQIMSWIEALRGAWRTCEAFDHKRMYTHIAAMSDESAQA